MNEPIKNWGMLILFIIGLNLYVTAVSTVAAQEVNERKIKANADKLMYSRWGGIILMAVVLFYIFGKGEFAKVFK